MRTDAIRQLHVLLLLLFAAGSSRAAVVRVAGGAWYSDSHVRASNFWLEAGAKLTGTGTVHAASRIQGTVSPGREVFDIGTLTFDGALAFDGGRFICRLDGSNVADKLTAAGGRVSGTVTVAVEHAASVLPYRNVVVEGGADSAYGGFEVAPTTNISWGQSGSLDFWITSMADQTIIFPAIPDQLATGVVGLSATASSGRGVSFAVESGPAILSNGTNLSFMGAGTVVVVASQSGDGTNWNAAASVTNVFIVRKAAARVFLLSLEQYYNGTARTITATTMPAGLTVEYSYNGSATAPSNASTYAVTGTIRDAVYQGEASGLFRILHVPSALGHVVWLDENRNGIRDTGETGLPNVQVQLLDSQGTVLDTTTTDLDGRYLFAGRTPGTYTVRVVAQTLAAGLLGTPTYDPDPVRDHKTAVTVAAGGATLSADFGYAWASSNAVWGAIGDRVWVDADNDGAQDPGEPGIPNVRIRLYHDAAEDGMFRSLLATVRTDAAGFYIFTNVPAGFYQVRVDTNTLPNAFLLSGDPDSFGETLPAGAGDHLTTAPVVLAPGDVYVNVDFGYRFPYRSRLGGQIFYDVDANEAFNPAAGDEGIAGMTVALLNGAGKIIAGTATDSAGRYQFTGLPAGSYSVWANDAGNVLASLVQTMDPDGGFDHRSVVTLDGRNDDLRQDQGFAPARHGPGWGLVGDSIFLDRDGNGQSGPGEGIQGATLYLYDASGIGLLDTTFSDSQGWYSFGGLSPGSYWVQVDVATLPNTGVGLRHSVDPDTAGTGDHRAMVTIGGSNPVLNQRVDFGYVPILPNTIGGTLWRDGDADGRVDSGETSRWAGMQIILRNVQNRIFGSTFTDMNGTYRFSRLPSGTYTVEVNDVSNRVHGYWQSLGPNPGADNQGQRMPYSLTVSGGQTNTTGDFGYYLAIAELGNYVWYDINGNGLQDGGEPGLSGVAVKLTIRYPNNTQIALQTKTDSSGHYLFSKLLLDERHRESTTNSPVSIGLPRLQVSIASTQSVLTANGYVATSVDAGNGSNDSRKHAGVFAPLNKDSRSMAYDFGYKGGPLLSVIGNVSAFTRGDQTIVQWETVESWGTAGFWLDRMVGTDWVRISPELLPFPIFGVAPIVYEETDPGAQAGGSYVYRLVELENDGDVLYYGPYTLTVDGEGHTFEDWISGHFTSAECAAPAISGRDADPDRDGLNNWQEFLAWTDPRNANSVLEVSGGMRTETGLQLNWNSTAGRRYKIAASDSMSGAFVPLEQTVLATDSNTTVLLPLDFSERQMYFRVILVNDP